MPDVWSHILCGQEVLAGAGESFRKMVQERKKIYFFGCQGPDFFYYYNFFPWKKNKRAVMLGCRIHHEKCGLFFRESLKYLKNNPNHEIIVYVMALISHWCLDRITHPYINYISGINSSNSESVILINNHKRVEATIDLLLARQMSNMELCRVPLYREIEFGDRLSEEIIAFYEYILPLIYGDSYRYLKGTDFLNKSYSHMISTLKVFYDPYGIKRNLAFVYDILSTKKMNIRYFFYKEPRGNVEEYLNEDHRPWCHPMDASEIYWYSFKDLFTKGVSESIELITLSLRFIREDVDEKEINNKINDISHSTGKTEGDMRAMRYFRPIFP